MWDTSGPVPRPRLFVRRGITKSWWTCRSIHRKSGYTGEMKSVESKIIQLGDRAKVREVPLQVSQMKGLVGRAVFHLESEVLGVTQNAQVSGPRSRPPTVVHERGVDHKSRASWY